MASQSEGVASLLDLPNETLTTIVNLIDCDESTSRFIVTSRRCREVAEPILYKQWKQTYRDQRAWTRRYRFLRTILHRPDLARLVTSISIIDVGMCDLRSPADFDREIRTLFTTPEWQKLELHMQTVVDVNWSEMFKEWFTGCHIDPAYILVFSLLPNLANIHWPEWEMCSGLMRKYIGCIEKWQWDQSIRFTSKALPKVKKISLGPVESEALDLRDLMEWNHLRSLRELQCFRVGTDRSDSLLERFESATDWQREGFSPGYMSEVEVLYLLDSGLDARAFSIIFDWFPQLKKLTYTYGANLSKQWIDRGKWEPPRMREALLKLKGSLEHLSLRNDADSFLQDEVLAFFPLGSLRHFTKLTIVSISVNLLQGYSMGPLFYLCGFPSHATLLTILPPGLKCLELFGCDEDICPDLQELIENRSDFPLLSALLIDTFECPPYGCFDGIRGVCKQRGILCVVTSCLTKWKTDLRQGIVPADDLNGTSCQKLWVTLRDVGVL